jgi:hypothetical protein
MAEPYVDGGAPPSASNAPGQPPPPPPPGSQSSQPPPPSAPDSQYVVASPGGQWVYLSGTGWVWVPADAAAADVEGVPYTYLYTPAYGWTWYVSPWGPGRFYWGPWYRHPWHPVGMHGYWLARPGIGFRLGGGYHGGHRR